MFGIDFSKFPDVFERILLPAIGETLYMSVVSTLLAFLIGLVPAILLVLSAQDGLKPNKPLFIALDITVNTLRSFPFIILIIVLFPLTYKGMLSMNKLKDLAPKVKELQAKYKGDPQKLNMHMMELYKKNGANPMGGCLPILMQIPIFFAIYRVLLNAIELKAAPWILWIHDLSVMDPYFVLPILMGATMFLQQKLTPTTFSDPMQEKIMKFLPLIFTFFFVTFPAGLTLYWFVNNVCSVVQQIFVNKLFEKHKRAEVKE